MKVLIILLLLSIVLTKPLYDHNRSYVQRITQLNFQKQVQKLRDTSKYVSIIHFYKHSDGHSPKFAKDLDQFSSEYRGVFKIGAVDCDADSNICEKERITQFPTVRVYPPTPLPSVDVEVPSRELNTQAVLKLSARYLHDNSVEITSANIDTFVKEHEAVPKVLLFTDKTGNPIIYKALSVSFEGKLFLGIVRHTEELVVQKYNIRKFPSVIVLINTEKKPIIYKGEMKYQPIFEFLNVYSQTFVPGGNQESSATKPWLSEVVPEIHIKSNRDICLGQEGILCVVLLSSGRPQQKQIDVLKNLHQLYDRKIERGIQYKFMWLDCSIEQKWAVLFGFENKPKVVIINPGKRKRFIDHEGDLTVNELQKTFDKINGGDARFKRLADSQIPDFSIRKDL
ncbi:hypothetical protein IMG5_198140 [Ichthyophthirius multifiliis]|uniref:Thioredoxin domain-containing protein n=1 Tax=Ichthyophthirius multifiliis TaxID=5932 RepID=G0R5E8_ICHMU|nr:hypothetical protein IMG5_198140 [Ichthyophthirius multifiliis]EGR27306.1 hypothetical protein IMG5_198140 [Ichthyophthirius multifiliis]|eukprot:XP_004024190.1 hypothetical protein IMG5_198140 [Ichthyophthirius multifiliis]